MTEKRVLAEHEEIRTWAAARMGSPAVVDTSPETGVQPQLRIVFDQASYEDQDQPERPPNAGGYDLVEWDEWFRLFDAADLVMVVSPEQPGVLDSIHEFIRRNRH